MKFAAAAAVAGGYSRGTFGRLRVARNNFISPPCSRPVPTRASIIDLSRWERRWLQCSTSREKKNYCRTADRSKRYMGVITQEK